MDDFKTDAVFCSSINRYNENKNAGFTNKQLLVTSNIKVNANKNEMIFNYLPLVKFGWINIDTAFILAIRLFLKIGVSEFHFAGFDGYNAEDKKFYYDNALLTTVDVEDFLLLTKETKEMLEDIMKTDNIKANFLTPSQYEEIFRKEVANV